MAARLICPAACAGATALPELLFGQGVCSGRQLGTLVRCHPASTGQALGSGSLAHPCIGGCLAHEAQVWLGMLWPAWVCGRTCQGHRAARLPSGSAAAAQKPFEGSVTIRQQAGLAGAQPWRPVRLPPCRAQHRLTTVVWQACCCRMVLLGRRAPSRAHPEQLLAFLPPRWVPSWGLRCGGGELLAGPPPRS